MGQANPRISDWQRRHRARRPALLRHPVVPPVRDQLHGEISACPLDKRAAISAYVFARHTASEHGWLCLWDGWGSLTGSMTRVVAWHVDHQPPPGTPSRFHSRPALSPEVRQSRLERPAGGRLPGVVRARPCCEELDTVVGLAHDLSVPFELSTAVQSAYRTALARYGRVDGEVLEVALLEEQAGMQLRASQRPES